MSATSSLSSLSSSSSYKVDLGWKHLNQRKFTFITLSASFTLRLMTYPMSLLKTNRQTQELKLGVNLSSKSSNSGNFQNSAKQSLIRKIYTTQGLRGFYKGITINLIGNSSHVLYATIYETTRELISNSMEKYFIKNSDDDSDKFIGPFASGIAGIFASISQLSISTPFDIITQKRMILNDNDINIIGARDIFKQILIEEGSIFGLWRGLTLSLMTYAPTSGIVWSSYKYLKPKIYEYITNNNFILNAIAGSISGGLGGLLTMPLDTIKVRKQVLAKRSTKSKHIIKNVYNELGLFGFWRGVIPRTCQYSVTCAIIMNVYDWVKRLSQNESK